MAIIYVNYCVVEGGCKVVEFGGVGGIQGWAESLYPSTRLTNSSELTNAPPNLSLIQILIQTWFFEPFT